MSQSISGNNQLPSIETVPKSFSHCYLLKTKAQRHEQKQSIYQEKPISVSPAVQTRISQVVY